MYLIRDVKYDCWLNRGSRNGDKEDLATDEPQRNETLLAFLRHTPLAPPALVARFLRQGNAPEIQLELVFPALAGIFERDVTPVAGMLFTVLLAPWASVLHGAG
jgi:hypothetical protein